MLAVVGGRLKAATVGAGRRVPLLPAAASVSGRADMEEGDAGRAVRCSTCTFEGTESARGAAAPDGGDTACEPKAAAAAVAPDAAAGVGAPGAPLPLAHLLPSRERQRSLMPAVHSLSLRLLRVRLRLQLEHVRTLPLSPLYVHPPQPQLL